MKIKEIVEDEETRKNDKQAKKELKTRDHKAESLARAEAYVITPRTMARRYSSEKQLCDFYISFYGKIKSFE